MFCSQSNKVTETNAVGNYLNIIYLAKYQNISNYINITQIENIKPNKVYTCVGCNKICLYLLVVLCGHVLCGCSYCRHFKLINYLKLNFSYT